MEGKLEPQTLLDGTKTLQELTGFLSSTIRNCIHNSYTIIHKQMSHIHELSNKDTDSMVQDYIFANKLEIN